MDIRQLRYFAEVVRQGSISRAAEVLYVAQPALSQHIRKLERELGVELIQRSARGVVPTEEGARLEVQARLILHQLELTREIVAGSAPPAGPVAFGMPSSTSVMLSVPLIETVRAELPGVRLRVSESMSGDIYDWLQGGRLDMGILYNAEKMPGLRVTRLFRERLYLIERPAGRRRRATATLGRPLPMAELNACELILPGLPHGLRELVESHARAAGITLDVGIEIDALTQIKRLVRRGAGATILAQSAVCEELLRGELTARPLVDPDIHRSVCLVFPRERPVTRATRAVEQRVRQCLERLVGEQEWQVELLV